MTKYTAIIASTDDLDLDDCNDIGVFLVSILKDGSLDESEAAAAILEQWLNNFDMEHCEKCYNPNNQRLLINLIEVRTHASFFGVHFHRLPTRLSPRPTLC